MNGNSMKLFSDFSSFPAIIAKLTKSIALIHRAIYVFMTAINLYGQLSRPPFANVEFYCC